MEINSPVASGRGSSLKRVSIFSGRAFKVSGYKLREDGPSLTRPQQSLDLPRCPLVILERWSAHGLIREAKISPI